MNRRARTAAFTLAELMVSLGVTSVIMAGLVTGTIALQKGFASADYSIRCQLDEMRVVDYITRDLRRATGATTENAGRKLVLTLPDQRDPVTNTLRVPVVTDGAVCYGGAPVTVAYYIEGDRFIREEGGVRTAIASKRLESFFVSLDAAQTVTFQLAFTPTYSASSGYGEAAATIVTSVSLSNAAGAYQ